MTVADKDAPNNAALQGPAPQSQGSWAARADYALSNPTVVGRVTELTPILPQVKSALYTTVYTVQ